MTPMNCIEEIEKEYTHDKERCKAVWAISVLSSLELEKHYMQTVGSDSPIVFRLKPIKNAVISLLDAIPHEKKSDKAIIHLLLGALNAFDNTLDDWLGEMRMTGRNHPEPWKEVAKFSGRVLRAEFYTINKHLSFQSSISVLTKYLTSDMPEQAYWHTTWIRQQEALLDANNYTHEDKV